MLELSSLGLLGLFVGCFLAATVLPFSSDALYVAVLVATKDPVGCLVWGTLGNWLGSVTTFYLGWLARWEWIERWLRIKPEKLARQKAAVDKYGVWLALVSWVPFIGDVIAVALGFYKTRPVPTLFLLLVGKFLRFAVWTLLIQYGFA